MKIPLSLLLFGIIGSAGFLIDTCILYLLKDFMGLFYARGISFSCSAIFTWACNRNITFKNKKSNKSKKAEVSIYFFLMILGGSINYGIYSITILNSNYAHNNPIVGVALGSIGGMVINFLTSRFLLFRYEHN